MKVLIAEDDFPSRLIMTKILSRYAECDITVDGKEAITAFNMALETDEPYDLACLDIMMPELDGFEALKAIREMEKEKNVPPEKKVKVVMTTALNDKKSVEKAFELGCEAYAGKPISQEGFIAKLQKLGLINDQNKTEIE